MKETSTRILLDRTVIRLDGRPVFSFGPRLYLTPREEIPHAIAEIANAGFTTLATPPASRGNRDVINLIFDHAAQHDLLVILIAEPRVPDPSSFLADEYRHRPNLHSYCLPLRDASDESLAWFCEERDRLRAKDLFHPIWTPYHAKINLAAWGEASEIHATEHATGGPMPLDAKRNGADILTAIRAELTGTRSGARPLFCHSLETSVPDYVREIGIYSTDTNARRLPARVSEWYPYATNLNEIARRDFLPPDPELLRLRVFELLAANTRGIITDYYDFLCGPAPYSGRDRFAELARLAQEIAVCSDFLAEGQPVAWEIETGHPRFQAALLQHSEDYLLLVWHSAPGDEFWIDPSAESRMEILVQLPPDTKLQAWRIDFPAVQPLDVEYDLKNAMRIQIDSVDLTAKIFLGKSRHRASEITTRLAERAKTHMQYMAEELQHRVQKIELVERELDEIGLESFADSLRKDAKRRLAKIDGLMVLDKIEEAHQEAIQLLQLLRSMIARRMVQALGSRQTEREPTLNLLRNSYYTLPMYYRETDLRDTRGILEFT